MNDGNRLQVLGRHECLALLGSVPVGRVIFTERALPAVQPVAFALDRDCVIICTEPGSKLAVATRGTVVAFEADDFHGADLHGTDLTGWSVTVVGHARHVRDPAEVARLSRLLRPWPAGAHDRFVRITGQCITGSRISPASTFTT